MSGPKALQPTESFENLVPPIKRDHLSNRCEYEVLVYHTKVGWESCNTEAEHKKRIWAKMRDYWAAYNYAVELSQNASFFKVLLRA